MACKPYVQMQHRFPSCREGNMSCHCTLIISEAITSKIQYQVKTVLPSQSSRHPVSSSNLHYNHHTRKTFSAWPEPKVLAVHCIYIKHRQCVCFFFFVLKPLRTVIVLYKQNSLYRPNREFCKVPAFQTYFGI